MAERFSGRYIITGATVGGPNVVSVPFVWTTIPPGHYEVTTENEIFEIKRGGGRIRTNYSRPGGYIFPGNAGGMYQVVKKLPPGKYVVDAQGAHRVLALSNEVYRVRESDASDEEGDPREPPPPSHGGVYF